MNRMSRVVIGGAVVGTVLLGGAAVAVAQEDPSSSQPAPVTITLSPEQVTRLCDHRLPKIEKRTSKLVERINGGADVRGSAAWLRARAEKERGAGRETSAELLEERADRREGRVEQLNQVNKWAADFRAEHCGAK
ncbi:hypothetical protein [Actinophytocola sp.]|uniref:hypothetical protein n=1 Tax=Actinophytocola sp. TaxID=1872138 RepID=UPI0025C39161|nr:hypothetical protein [Actinophytocola sp.]